MSYCSSCGSEIPHEISPEEQERRELVEIERIRADKEIAIARMQARSQREELETVENVAETEAEAEVLSAEAEAEALAAVVEASTESEPEPIPIPISAPEPEPEPEAPPVVEEHHEKTPAKPKGFFG